MSLYNKRELEENLNHYGIPIHEDIFYVFENREHVQEIMKDVDIIWVNHKIDTVLYAIDLDEYRDEDFAEYDVGVVMTPMDECLYLKEDIHLANATNMEPVLRIVPFARMDYGDYLCFYYKDFNLRPEIVFFDKEESAPENAHIIFVAKNLDEFMKMAQTSI